MLFRFLLNLIKPSNEQLRNKATGRFTRQKIWLYQLFLRRLCKTYLHYAISDTIIMDNGKIKIVHEYRDLEFESELTRNRIEFKTDVVDHSIPLSVKKNRVTGYFSFFKFKDLLSLYVDGNELFVKHDEAYSIDGTVRGKIRCASKNNCLTQSVIDILSSCDRNDSSSHISKDQRTANLWNDSNLRQRKKTPHQNIFKKEKELASVITPNKFKSGHTELIYDNKPKPIEKRGFDIDTSF